MTTAVDPAWPRRRDSSGSASAVSASSSINGYPCEFCKRVAGSKMPICQGFKGDDEDAIACVAKIEFRDPLPAGETRIVLREDGAHVPEFFPADE